MMRIYRVGCIDAAQRLDMAPEDQAHLFRGRLGSGKTFSEKWTPPTVWHMVLPRLSDRNRRLCDITIVANHIGTPVLSARAKQAFEPRLGANVEWLPLPFDGCEYWLLNVLRTVELDKTRAVTRDFSDGQPGPVEKYAFHESDVADLWLFKAHSWPISVLCTERVRDLVEAEQLTGFWFRCAWDSTYEPFGIDRINDSSDVLSRPEIYGPDGIQPGFERYWPPEWKQRAQELKKERVLAAKQQQQRGPA
jgi:hypothetical protein